MSMFVQLKVAEMNDEDRVGRSQDPFVFHLKVDVFRLLIDFLKAHIDQRLRKCHLTAH